MNSNYLNCIPWQIIKTLGEAYNRILIYINHITIYSLIQSRKAKCESSSICTWCTEKISDLNQYTVCCHKHNFGIIEVRIAFSVWLTEFMNYPIHWLETRSCFPWRLYSGCLVWKGKKSTYSLPLQSRKASESHILSAWGTKNAVLFFFWLLSIYSVLWECWT